MIKKGATRLVIIIGNYAFKIPSLYSWRNFLQGLLANISEVQFSRCVPMQYKLCPIVFSIPLGFLVVMPKVRVLNDGEMTRENLKNFCLCNDDWMIPAEHKTDSFGYLKGKLVAIDYGDIWHT